LKQRFVFCGKLPKSSSNGLQTFFDLCASVGRIGYESIFIPFQPDGAGGYIPILRSQVKDGVIVRPYELFEDYKKLESDIVIYSETFPGNFLGLSRVVRYFGNRVGYCSARDPQIGEDEYKLAHSKIILESPDHILFNANTINLNFISKHYSAVIPRRLDITYTGKGELYGETPTIPGTIEVNRSWPTSQEQTLNMLCSTRNLFSYDSFTQILVEGVLCGALPIILRLHPWSEADLRSGEFENFFFVTIEDFNQRPSSTELYRSLEVSRQRLISEIVSFQSSWLTRVKGFADDVVSKI